MIDKVLDILNLQSSSGVANWEKRQHCRSDSSTYYGHICVMVFVIGFLSIFLYYPNMFPRFFLVICWCYVDCLFQFTFGSMFNELVSIQFFVVLSMRALQNPTSYFTVVISCSLIRTFIYSSHTIQTLLFKLTLFLCFVFVKILRDWT